VAEPRWRAADPATIRIASLDGLTALYHRPSGQTHLVTEPVPEILEVLGNTAMTVGELVAALAADRDVSGDEDALLERLAELTEAGLVTQL
jgi:PqqD family protein of HPr-rel-A system